MRPPGIKPKFEDNNVWVQARILGYSQIREHEDMQLAALGVPKF